MHQRPHWPRCYIGTFCLSLLSFWLVASKALSCTVFCTVGEGHSIVGKSFDWASGVGLVYVNPRGQSKRGIVFDGSDQTSNSGPHWVSKYGSVTFNQFGKDHPVGGMNEKGLVVEALYSSTAQLPAHDSRHAINDLQWMQYQLDNYATIAEVEKNIAALRVSPAFGKIHYMVCEGSGACLSIDWVEGMPVLHHLKKDRAAQDGSLESLPVLTNDPYSDSVRRSSRFNGAGGESRLPDPEESTGNTPTARFTRAALALREHAPQTGDEAEREAFRSLDRLRLTKGLPTQWNLVYDQTAKKIRFTVPSHHELSEVEIDFSKLNFDSTAPQEVMDVTGEVTGRRTGTFVRHTEQMSRKLISLAYGAIEPYLTPEVKQNMIARLTGHGHGCPEEMGVIGRTPPQNHHLSGF